MFEKKVKFTDTEDVKEFVRAAEQCDFDIDCVYYSTVIDAKSLLGMICLGICKELTIKYGEEDKKFENVIQKYAIA